MIRRSKTVRIGVVLLMISLSFMATTSLAGHAASYSMSYNLTYTGVPFAGGAIVLGSNFTNTGQLTLRVTAISFASDFWSNGTRQVISGLLFNITAGTSKQVDTPVVIPANVSIGNHIVTAKASWQYNNSSVWFDASPIVTTTKVMVSQTIGSLFASFATVLIIGLVVAAVIIAVVVLVIVLKKKNLKPQDLPPTPPH